MGKLEIKNEKFHSDGILENTTRFKNLVEVIEVDEEIIKRTTFDKKNNISTEVDKNSFQKEVEVNTNKEKEIKITDEDVLDLNKDKKLDDQNIQEELKIFNDNDLVIKKKNKKKEKDEGREREYGD
ncbi:hypothetical protein [Fusobacterium polymorphum]|jgi:hypothetical protein|uniref:Uncharacterized protein n=2 Tax=Fusobacterium TaxID=848 RepID=A0A241Q0X2_FUSNP|nr:MULTISPECIES: hypothetical protein [Fusobacterium]ASG28368.1 hypothetical protein CBG61_05120 [Fusobacterium polymorphum]ETZ29591.1 hypothetical protein HMPREF2085_00409 [Fusobacterium nucleatum 13_3C]